MFRSITLALAALVPAAAAGAQSYRVQPAIAVPGDGGWDYASVDPLARKLYVAHNDAVSVVDLATMRAVKPLGPVAHTHAVVPLTTRELAVTSGGDDSVRFFDPARGTQSASVAVDRKPDAAVVDPGTGHLLTMNAGAGTVAEIDVAVHRVLRTIRIKPGLEYPLIRGRTLYINNEDANEIEVVDLAHGTVGKLIALPGCEGPTGLGLDSPHARLVSACGNGVAAVVDLATGKLAQRVPIGGGPDTVMIDARRKVALIPAGQDGVLDVLDLSAARVTAKAKVKTAPGARTGAIDTVTGTVYLPTATLVASQGKHPGVAPGTFRILVLKPN